MTFSSQKLQLAITNLLNLNFKIETKKKKGKEMITLSI